MRTIKQIIATEVFTNISQLVTHVIMANSGYVTEFYDNLNEDVDWDELINEIDREIDESEITEWLETCGYDCLENLDITDSDVTGNIREFAEDNSIDIYDFSLEFMEYYAVSDWLGSILTDIGYPVSEFEGLTIMCRTTTGQSLEMDYFWHQVIARMEQRVASL